jgi:hypothetical protein
MVAQLCVSMNQAAAGGSDCHNEACMRTGDKRIEPDVGANHGLEELFIRATFCPWCHGVLKVHFARRRRGWDRVVLPERAR